MLLNLKPKMNFTFRGLMAPVFTPFDECGDIDDKVISKYAIYLKRKDIEGILVNGTTGEGISMTSKERSEVLRKWVEAKLNYNWRVTIMVQVGGTNLNSVKFLANDAEKQRAGAILCLPDLFFKPSKLDDLISYLQIVSKYAPQTPLLYYHIPAYTGVNLNMKDLIDASFQIPNFVGIKYTDDLKESMFTPYHNQNSAVFVGCDRGFLQALMMGFDSAISTTVNLFPDLHQNILRFYKEGKYIEAQLEQEKLNRNIDKITKYGSWVSTMKGAMKKITDVNVGFVRPPLTDVNFSCVNLNLE